MSDPTTITAYLSRDHDRLDALLAQIYEHASKGDLVAAGGPFAEFADGLVRHMRIEEQSLFGEFERRTGMLSGPTQVLRTEHRALEHALDRMRAALAAADAEVFVRGHDDLVEILVAHHLKEEEVLYPMALRSLPESDDSDQRDATSSSTGRVAARSSGV